MGRVTKTFFKHTWRIIIVVLILLPLFLLLTEIDFIQQSSPTEGYYYDRAWVLFGYKERAYKLPQHLIPSYVATSDPYFIEIKRYYYGSSGIEVIPGVLKYQVFKFSFIFKSLKITNSYRIALDFIAGLYRYAEVGGGGIKHVDLYWWIPYSAYSSSHLEEKVAFNTFADYRRYETVEINVGGLVGTKEIFFILHVYFEPAAGFELVEMSINRMALLY